jgi:hypothetical protein
MGSVIADNRNAIKLPAQCASAVAGTVIVAALFRATLNRIFFVDSQPFWLAITIELSLFVGILWFAFTFAFCILQAIRGVNSQGTTSTSGSSVRHFAAIFGLALAAAVTLAVSALLTLEANDQYFFSRSLPWIPSLVWLQGEGIGTASRLFPCQYEGFDTGCEIYKTLPAVVFSNAIAYLPFSFTTLLLTHYRESARVFLRVLSSALLRWGSLVGIGLLCLRLFLSRLSPGISSPIAPPGFAHSTWILLEWTLGPISVALALCIPFALYGAIYAVWRRQQTLGRLVELTCVAAFVLAAMILGNQYQ